jgi:hypothetical protein
LTHYSELLQSPAFEQWDQVRNEIEQLYVNQDKKAMQLMKVAIQSYTELLESGGVEQGKFVCQPLNGEERIQFVQEKIASHYAFVQLDALYTEVKKKIARLAVLEKKKS